MVLNKTVKKISAGFMAGLCAFSMLASSAANAVPIEAAALSSENETFPSSDAVVAQAATLLGTKYGFGFKGYTGAYYQGGYKAMTETAIRNQGIDCSGLIYYTLTHLGYSTTGFSWNNPVPVDTDDWLEMSSNCTITYGGVTSQVDVEKKGIKTEDAPYWECADGSTITPGSVVVAEIPNDINHSWIYMGEFDSRDDVVAYLLRIGVPESLITSETVSDGSGDGGTHWRIESNGTNGVVINNNITGKKTSAMNMYAFRVTQSNVNFTITKVLSTDNSVKISGTSPIDNSKAVYGVYTDSGCTEKVGEITIGEDGTGSIELPVNRTYYVKEISAPTGYSLSPEVYELKANGSVNVVEDYQNGKIRVNKTSEDGIVSNRQFELTWTENGIEHTKTAVTDDSGVAEFPNLRVYDLTMKNAITYTVSEINTDERYIQPVSQNIQLTSGDADLTVTADFENVLKKGSLQINKQSEDSQNSDRHFTVSGGGQIYHITTGADGIAVLPNIPVFDSNNEKIVYTVSENDVPVRYVIPAEQTATLSVDATTDLTFENTLKKFTAEVTKQDAECITAQGDATLAGAVYGLYRDGELVDSYTTDENGCFKTNSYPCGNYTIREISPSAGYLLDDTVYTLGTQPENYSIELNNTNLTVYETPVKGNVSILKHSDENADEVINLETGAEFEIYLKSSGSYENAPDTVRDYLVTDENGYAQTKDMPYGQYTVHQTKTVNDADFVSDFDVLISENGRIYEYVLNDTPFSSYIQVEKLDAETGKAIAYQGAGFQIFNSVNQAVTLGGTDTFYTDNNGILMTPESLAYGDYTLVEVQAPMGYVLDSTPIPFSVTAENSEEENAVNIIKLTKSDVAQKGRISIQKTGKAFTTVNGMGYAYENENESVSRIFYVPIFEEKGLENAVFQVIASEDIITADGTVRASVGDIVAELTTNADGYAESDLLYLGKYEIKEISAPYGYVLNDESHSVELTYAGQEITVRDTVQNSFENDYQSVRIHMTKAMEHDEKYSIGGNKEYLSVRFGLFAAEDITADDGSVIPENGLIAEISLNEDMTATIAEQLPFARYYVQEIATDEHYVLNGEKYLVTFEYQGQEMTTVDIDCGQFKNTLKRGSVDGKKTNPDGEPLSGAVIGLFRADAEDFSSTSALDTKISDENGYFSFQNVPYGSYIIREIQSPEGYILSEKTYPVTIAEDKETVEITIENSPLKVAVSKEDVYGEELSGAQMEILDETGNIVEEWTSDGTNHIISEISAGSYTLREVAAPNGYVIATDISFAVDDRNVVKLENAEVSAFTEDGIPLITMIDDTTAVKISKQSITGGDELSGAKLQVIDSDGIVVEEWTSGDEPHFIEAKLTGGASYTLREITAPDGYEIAEDITFTVKTDGTVTEVVMKDEQIPETTATTVPKTTTTVIATTPTVTVTSTPPTGDTGKNSAAYAMLIAGLCGLTAAVIMLRKKDEDE
ncbi:MAG: TonB-dependent receptor [Oscillospiraceae bacterium]|nr:TonB-dependent receptor [Oscillospiraceae bacterium]